MASNFLSIITINYNQAEGLRKTITSVLSQTFIDYEYLIIDGKSTDQSVQIIKESENKIKYWVSEKDSGIYNAMNKGIKVANGKYLLFLNSGDTFVNKNSLINFINHNKFIGHIIYGDYKFKKGEKVFPDDVTPLYLMKSSLPHQSTFFKKIVFDEIGPYNEKFKITSDREFYIKCLLSEKYVFSHIPIALTVFDQKGISSDKNFQEIKRNENEQIFKKYFGVYYSDLKYAISIEHENNRLKRNKLKYFFKRLKKSFNYG